MRNTHSIAAGIIASFISFQSVAEIQFNGFASIRGSYMNSDNGESAYLDLKEGRFDFKGDSLFGLQARADLGDNLSATIQLYADGSDNFDIEARWAYITYELNDTHQFSMGRFANPMFHQSEYEKVGFAHNFARLPTAVYIGFPFAVVEGVGLDSSFDVGDYTLQTKLLYGNWEGDIFFTALNQRVDLGLDDIFSINATLSGDWWSIYAGGFTSDLSAMSFDQNIVAQLAAPGAAAALEAGASQSDVDGLMRALNWDGKPGDYIFAGFSVNYSNWLVDFEYVDYGAQDSSGSLTEAWFFAIGRQFDGYVITVHTEDYAQNTNDSALNGVTNPILLATGQAIQEGIAARQFDGAGISLRYDFHPSAALKVEYFAGDDSRSTVGNYDVFSIGIDLVF